jgi:hypothetical protein
MGRIMRNRIIFRISFFALYLFHFFGKPAKLDIEWINHPNMSRTIHVYLIFALTVTITMQGLMFVRKELSCLSQFFHSCSFGNSDSSYHSYVDRKRNRDTGRSYIPDVRHRTPCPSPPRATNLLRGGIDECEIPE